MEANVNKTVNFVTMNPAGQEGVTSVPVSRLLTVGISSKQIQALLDYNEVYYMTRDRKSKVTGVGPRTNEKLLIAIENMAELSVEPTMPTKAETIEDLVNNTVNQLMVEPDPVQNDEDLKAPTAPQLLFRRLGINDLPGHMRARLRADLKANRVRVRSINVDGFEACFQLWCQSSAKSWYEFVRTNRAKGKTHKWDLVNDTKVMQVGFYPAK